jgi:2-isopropylmalate synthase
MERVLVFDTTLRDGEQSPGASMYTGEKLRIAEELARAGVDVIEAGFPIASPQDFEAVRKIAYEIRGPIIAGLARTTDVDIDRAAEAVEVAERPRIHTFIATSDIHLEHKLRISREECVDRAVEAVSRAKRYVDDVEFSAEDATRTAVDFFCRIFAAAIEAGATTINVPDTVGYAIPADYDRIMAALYEKVPGIRDVVVSVHCHDDLGLAVANSLRAIQLGARQVECTINGIGERAGNASLEEIVMALKVRKDLGGFETGNVTERLCPASELLSHISGVRPQPNKAIVGENAFAHEAGIHQDGMLKSPMTYEIMRPEAVGARKTRLVLGKHSGRHALGMRYQELGYTLDEDALDAAYRLFLLLADSKKVIRDEDLMAIYYQGTMEDVPRTVHLEHLEVVCGRRPSRAVVCLRQGSGEATEAVCHGDGPIAAAFEAVRQLIPFDCTLEDFSIQSAGAGSDAVGEVHLEAETDGRSFHGRAASTDVVDAAVRALLNALDKAFHARELQARSGAEAPSPSPYATVSAPDA